MSGIEGPRQRARSIRLARDWWRRGFERGMAGGLPETANIDFRSDYREGYEAGVVKRLKGDK